MKRKAIAPPNDNLPTIHKPDCESYPVATGIGNRRQSPQSGSSLLRRSRLSTGRQQGDEAFSQRRDSFRIAVSLKTVVEWVSPAGADEPTRVPCVVTSLSGGGALLFLRCMPEVGTLSISFNPPYDYVEERAKSTIGTSKIVRRPRGASYRTFLKVCESVRSKMRKVEANMVNIVEYSRDGRGPVYAVSISFAEPVEELHRFVRYFEREGLNREARLISERSSRPTSAGVAATA